MRFTSKPRFERMNIAAGGTIHAALTEHRILRTTNRDLTFVIARARLDAARALNLAVELAAAGPTYTVLLTDEHLTRIQDGDPRIDVDVLDARKLHKTTGRIKVNGKTEVDLNTEHGRFTFTAALADTLHAGDVFARGDFTIDGRGREVGLTLYRAATDFNPADQSFEQRILTRTWDSTSPDDRANLTRTITLDPAHVVYRATARDTAILRHLDAADPAQLRGPDA